ncbi:carboxy-terminal domain RNA polymerase II polypeptide A small phosphatase 2-like isoform X1 [Amblyraja radiata]|uniref:carboxy-terminal domain RNA polymerase II polypeptide A small phosphatase 2-like isoform X1 n=1 Tax=Amblyraja radiata TaxID=386614 RepID=UPI00140321C3|nr:carboxy-terminal domain RNA polymerase II polypeptide A small phosphatase 2-like isoform X1 [Amblyraja radiata]
MNLRSGKATSANPFIPRTPRCTKVRDGLLETPPGGDCGEPSKTARSAGKTTPRASSRVRKARRVVTFDNVPDSFSTTPGTKRLPRKRWQEVEFKRGFDSTSCATKSHTRVRFHEEHHRPVTRNNHNAKQTLSALPIFPSATPDMDTNRNLDRGSVPLEWIFSINVSMDATSLCAKKETFNQYKFFKEFQSSTEDSLQKSILPLKTRSVPDYSLVLGLDETLVHCQLAPMENPDFVFSVHFQDKNYQVYVRLRPYCREFLETISQFYEIILFTSATKDYSDKVLDILDPQRRIIRHRLHRKHCTSVMGSYVKELMVLGRDLAKTVFVDSSAEAFVGQTANGILVKSWLESHSDQELRNLIPLLQKLAELVRRWWASKTDGSALSGFRCILEFDICTADSCAFSCQCP